MYTFLSKKSWKRRQGEQFWFKDIITNCKAKQSLLNPVVTWKDSSKTSSIPYVASTPHLTGKDFLVLYVKGNNQPKLDASKKAGTGTITMYLSMTDAPHGWFHWRSLA